MTWTPPATAADFKDRFDREFPYGAGLETVRDKDIDRALEEARSLFNSTIWANESEAKVAYLYLSAHFLWSNLRAAGGFTSIVNAGRALDIQGGGPIAAKSVGPTSLNYALAQKATESPLLAPLLESKFGIRYLQMFFSRRAGGGMAVVDGFSEFDEFS